MNQSNSGSLKPKAISVKKKKRGGRESEHSYFITNQVSGYSYRDRPNFLLGAIYINILPILETPLGTIQYHGLYRKRQPA